MSPKRIPGVLTEREREVLSLVAEGKGNKEIAEILGISDHTVKAYLARIMAQLQMPDRTSAVIEAVRRGQLQLRGVAVSLDAHSAVPR